METNEVATTWLAVLGLACSFATVITAAVKGETLILLFAGASLACVLLAGALSLGPIHKEDTGTRSKPTPWKDTN